MIIQTHHATRETPAEYLSTAPGECRICGEPFDADEDYGEGGPHYLDSTCCSDHKPCRTCKQQVAEFEGDCLDCAIVGENEELEWRLAHGDIEEAAEHSAEYGRLMGIKKERG